jgi:hypothetical protein
MIIVMIMNFKKVKYILRNLPIIDNILHQKSAKKAKLKMMQSQVDLT